VHVFFTDEWTWIVDRAAADVLLRDAHPVAPEESGR